jgi:hypothetical protein
VVDIDGASYRVVRDGVGAADVAYAGAHVVETFDPATERNVRAGREPQKMPAGCSHDEVSAAAGCGFWKGASYLRTG